MENLEKNAVYTTYNKSISELVEQFRGFCMDEYGDRCEFGKVTVEREKDGGSWKLHEYNGLSDKAVQAFKNHLKAPTDIIRIRFGSSEDQNKLEFIVAKAGNSASISRHVKKEHLKDLDEDQIIVLALGENNGRKRKFIESLK